MEELNKASSVSYSKKQIYSSYSPSSCGLPSLSPHSATSSCHCCSHCPHAVSHPELSDVDFIARDIFKHHLSNSAFRGWLRSSVSPAWWLGCSEGFRTDSPTCLVCWFPWHRGGAQLGCPQNYLHIASSVWVNKPLPWAAFPHSRHLSPESPVKATWPFLIILRSLWWDICALCQDVFAVVGVMKSWTASS